jgi:hypothetical protein
MFVVKQLVAMTHKSGIVAGQVTVSAGRLLTQLQSTGSAALLENTDEKQASAGANQRILFRLRIKNGSVADWVAQLAGISNGSQASLFLC